MESLEDIITKKMSKSLLCFMKLVDPKKIRVRYAAH